MKLTIRIFQRWGLAMDLGEMVQASGEAEVEVQEAVHSAQSIECMSCDLQWNTCRTCNPAQSQIHSIYCLTGITFHMKSTYES